MCACVITSNFIVVIYFLDAIVVDETPSDLKFVTIDQISGNEGDGMTPKSKNLSQYLSRFYCIYLFYMFSLLPG